MGNNEKVKNFLQLKLNECKEIIKKRKRKNMIIKIMYSTSISISIIGSSIAVILSSVAVPTVAIACVSGVATLSSALSIKFKLQDRKNKLERNIQHLNKIKDKLGYIISCNGDLSEDECNRILDEFRIL